MEGIRDLLRSSLKRSLRDLSAEDRLAAAWPVACGSMLAAKGEVESLDANAVLRVRVSAVEWMPPFAAARSVLTSELGKIAGVPVSEIHFYVKNESHTRATAVTPDPAR